MNFISHTKILFKVGLTIYISHEWIIKSCSPHLKLSLTLSAAIFLVFLAILATEIEENDNLIFSQRKTRLMKVRRIIFSELEASESRMVRFGTPLHPEEVKLVNFESSASYCALIRESYRAWEMRDPQYRDPIMVVSGLICELPETGPLADVISSLVDYLRDYEYYYTQSHISFPSWEVRKCKDTLEAYKRQMAREGMGDTSMSFEAITSVQSDYNGD